MITQQPLYNQDPLQQTVAPNPPGFIDPATGAQPVQPVNIPGQMVPSNAPSTFSPSSQSAMANIYGTPIEGSFGRNMDQNQQL